MELTQARQVVRDTESLGTYCNTSLYCISGFEHHGNSM